MIGWQDRHKSIALRPRVSEAGFVLPSVIVLSLGIMLASITALQVIVASSNTLNDQYYTAIAKEAAQAGVMQGSNCIVKNSTAWTTLTPDSNNECGNGNLGAKLLAQDNWASTFRVTQSNSALGQVVKAVGTVTLYTNNSHTTPIRTFSKTINSILSSDGNPGNVNATPAKVVTKVSNGEAHSCALSGGAAYCWGHNENGQLGRGNFINTGDPVLVKANTPSDILYGKKVTDIQLGQSTSCVIAERDNTPGENEVDCWGINNRGQLGDETQVTSPVPVRVHGLDGKRVTKLSMGTNITGVACALTDEVGTVNAYCWGGNERGQVGNGATGFAVTKATKVSDPNGVFTGKQIIDITANNYVTCALTDEGKVYCWGKNAPSPNEFGLAPCNLGIDFYGLGGGAGCPVVWTSPKTAINQAYFGNKPVTKLTAGGWTLCAITDKAYCWGNDGGVGGTLGRGSNGNTSVPATVYSNNSVGLPPNQPVTDIDVDSDTTCSISGGQLYCWGRNTQGQLGIGSTYNSSNAARYVSTFSNTLVTSIATGYRHECAVAGGAVYCWGSDPEKLLIGNSQYSYSYTPILTSNSDLNSPFPASLLSTGDTHTCAIIDNTVFCWGNNSDGQLGNGVDKTDRKIPTQLPSLATKNASLIASGNGFSCASITATGGSDQIYCWGKNNKGQLGIGTASSAPVLTPTLVKGLPASMKVTSLSAGETHACAVANSNVYCWGANDQKQLGDTTTTQRTQATLAKGALPAGSAQTVSAGNVSTCATAADYLYCWGKNESGVIGVNDGNTGKTFNPVRVTSGAVGLKRVDKVSVSRSSAGPFACAVLKAEKNTVCWGEGIVGQLGDGIAHLFIPLISDSYETKPINATAGALNNQSISAITTGNAHGCALANNTSLMCWGEGLSGQIGNNQNDLLNSAKRINTFGSLRANGVNRYVTDVSAGPYHTCAVADSVIHCWGKNDHGQLGTNDNTNSRIPRQVSKYSTVNGAPNATGILY